MKALTGLALAVMLPATAAGQTPTRHDRQIVRAVQQAVLGCGWFSIFDDLDARVENGVITLTGHVTMPYKRADIVERASRIGGVSRVVDHVAVLPASPFDDELRLRLARAIYGNTNFSSYALMANPPIHIVVDRGRVTLTGVVQSPVDRALARTLATQPGVMSVTNNLKTIDEVKNTDDES